MFPTQPNLSPVPGPWWRPSYRVADDWWCEWTDRASKRRRILVPQGMPLDGSSEWILVAASSLPALALWALGLTNAALIAAAFVPVLLWVLGVAQDGLHRAATTGHDCVYAPAGRLKVETLIAGVWTTDSAPLSRFEADWLLLDVQRTRGVWWWRRYPRWVFVVVAGAPVWWLRKKKQTVG